MHRLRVALAVPVYGVVDWNAWGCGVLLTYRVGSARLGLEAQRYTVDAKWLGLRTSQVKARGLPPECLQPLTDRDRARAKGLLAHPWVKTRDAWRAELSDQLDLGTKCELEAILYDNNIDAVADFIETAITKRDWLE